jgi:hypothetical protein
MPEIAIKQTLNDSAFRTRLDENGQRVSRWGQNAIRDFEAVKKSVADAGEWNSQKLKWVFPEARSEGTAWAAGMADAARTGRPNSLGVGREFSFPGTAMAPSFDIGRAAEASSPSILRALRGAGTAALGRGPLRPLAAMGIAIEDLSVPTKGIGLFTAGLLIAHMAAAKLGEEITHTREEANKLGKTYDQFVAEKGLPQHSRFVEGGALAAMKGWEGAKAIGAGAFGLAVNMFSGNGLTGGTDAIAEETRLEEEAALRKQKAAEISKRAAEAKAAVDQMGRGAMTDREQFIDQYKPSDDVLAQWDQMTEKVKRFQDALAGTKEVERLEQGVRALRAELDGMPAPNIALEKFDAARKFKDSDVSALQANLERYRALGSFNRPGEHGFEKEIADTQSKLERATKERDTRGRLADLPGEKARLESRLAAKHDAEEQAAAVAQAQEQHQKVLAASADRFESAMRDEFMGRQGESSRQAQLRHLAEQGVDKDRLGSLAANAALLDAQDTVDRQRYDTLAPGASYGSKESADMMARAMNAGGAPDRTQAIQQEANRLLEKINETLKQIRAVQASPAEAPT